MGDFEGRINHPLCGAVFFISPTISEEMEEFVSNFYSDKLGFRHWYSESEDKYHVVELFTLHANKAIALEEIRKYYDIPLENTIAIGDGSNDLEMLEYAHYSAAMKNAKDTVKKSAKSITDSNNENGVINFIKTIIK
ncbi:HAD-IIB family hydrolase [Mycoplasmatota bacterium WC44]